MSELTAISNETTPEAPMEKALSAKVEQKKQIDNNSLVDATSETSKSTIVQEETQTVTQAENINVEEPVLVEEASRQSATTEEPSQKFPSFYIIKAGDTLYSVSLKYNIKLKALRKWNKITSSPMSLVKIWKW